MNFTEFLQKNGLAKTLQSDYYRKIILESGNIKTQKYQNWLQFLAPHKKRNATLQDACTRILARLHQKPDFDNAQQELLRLQNCPQEQIGLAQDITTFLSLDQSIRQLQKARNLALQEYKQAKITCLPTPVD